MNAPVVDDAPWSRGSRLLFRFGFVYLLLYNLPWPLGWIPGTHAVAGSYEAGRDRLLAWFGHSVLGIDRDLAPFPTGSGDTTRDYVLLALWPVLALVLAAVWSLCTHKRAHPRLADLLRTYLRYVLASTMLGYGTAKWFGGQFRELDVPALMSTWGDSSPMGVVWKFMGASPAYTVASGCVECLGGALLLRRRTASLGAIVTIVAMANVVLINFCYDVPVKLYSSHLLLMAFVVLQRDVARLANVLFGNRAAEPLPLYRPGSFAARWPVRIVKAAAVLWLLWGMVAPTYERWRNSGAPAGPLQGSYEVVEFVRDGAAVPPLPDAARWQLVSFWQGGLRVRMTDGRTQAFYRLAIDEAKGTLTLQPVRRPGDTGPEQGSSMLRFCSEPVAAAGGPADATASRAQGGPHAAEAAAAGARAGASAVAPGLRIEGTLAGAAICARLRVVRPESFFLRQHAFTWIQEYPRNR